MRGSREAERPHWLIVKPGVSGIEVLTVDLGGSAEALAVFTFEKRTRSFLDLWLGSSGKGWKARQTWPGELTSVLYGPCSAVKKVALDPLPEAVDGERSVALQAVDRDDFLERLLGEGPAGMRLKFSRIPGAYKGLLQSSVA